MTTLKTAVVPAKQLKSGKHKIRIAVRHKQETRYIVTRYTIDDITNFKDGQVIGIPDAHVINVKLRNILNSYQDALDKLSAEAYTPTHIIEYLSRTKGESLPFLQSSNNVIHDMEEENRIGTSGLYKITLRYFADFLNGDILFDCLTPKTIKDFDLFLSKSKNLNPTTRGIHMAHIKAIINAAIRDKEVKFETYPFEYYVIPSLEVRELDISIEELKLIRNCQITEKSMRMARDAFMLSYYLGGINLIDLMNINFKGATIIEYIREKSKNTKKGDKKISLSIPPEAVPIIKE